MFKRVIWTGVGFGMGLGSSYWVKRTVTRAVNERVDKVMPREVRTRVATSAQKVRRDVGAAVREGRDTMAAYRAEAEAEVSPPPRHRRNHLRAVGDP